MSGRLAIVVTGPAPGITWPATMTLVRAGDTLKSPPAAVPPVTFDRKASAPLALIAGYRRLTSVPPPVSGAGLPARASATVEPPPVREKSPGDAGPPLVTASKAT